MITTLTHRPAPAPAWPRWPLNLTLAILFLGPIIAPLFQATGLPLIADSGWLARDLLSRFVCPTPERSYMLLGLPMAVCARCWGATIGLWLARWAAGRWAAVGQGNAFTSLPWATRLLICGLPFLLWPLEIIGHYSGWWYAPMPLLLLNGAQAGFAAGLFFCSLWPGLWPARQATQNKPNS
jgi:Predicted membrane protein (DUF2085)